MSVEAYTGQVDWLATGQNYGKNSFFHSLTAGPVKIYGQRASKTLIVWPSGPVGKFFYVEPCICVSICAPIRFLYVFRKTVYLK